MIGFLSLSDHSFTGSGGFSHSSTSGTLSHSPPCAPSLCFSSGLTSKFWNWSSKSQVFDLREQCTFSMHPQCSTGACTGAQPCFRVHFELVFPPLINTLKPDFWREFFYTLFSS